MRDFGFFLKQQFLQFAIRILRPDGLDSRGNDTERATVPQFIVVPKVEDNIVSSFLKQPCFRCHHRVLSAALLVRVVNQQDLHACFTAMPRSASFPCSCTTAKPAMSDRPANS